MSEQGLELAAREAAIEPMVQGDLDGLCGLYSIINAIRLLEPQLEEEAAVDLMGTLLAALGRRRGDARSVVMGGIRPRRMRRLLKTAAQFARESLGVDVSARRLSADIGRAGNLQTVQSALAVRLATGCVAIVRLVHEDHAHWTVMRAVDGTRALLFDSDGLKELRWTSDALASDEAAYRVTAHKIFLLTRSAP